MRSVNSGSYTSIAQVANNVTSYTDLTPPSGTLKYRIDILTSAACSPTAKTTAYNKVSSNDVTVFPTGIRSTAYSKTDIYLYPNPTTNTINVVGLHKDYHIAMEDMTGRTIMKWNITDNEPNHQFILTDIADGAYMLKVVDEHNINVAVLRLNKIE
jgi:hypothetical protein